jgi:hypothetical protein
MVVIMTKDEALKLALKALKTIDEAMPFPVAKLAIKECEAALEAKDDPVAWMCADESLINKGYARFSHVCMGEWKIPVYATTPQRKPLTNEEISLIDWESLVTKKDCVRAIEAAHGIKEEA